MRIESLAAEQFRNLAAFRLEGFGNLNVFWGKNGQGKTNLLETIYLLSGGSFRTRSEEELICDGTSQAWARIVVREGELSHVVEIRLVRGGRKEIVVDGKTATVSQLAAHFPVVLFSPEEVDLIRNAAQYRRRIIDQLGFMVDGSYKTNLAEYVRVWRHRNQLLLAVKQGRAAEGELDVWDDRLAAVGTQLVVKRQELVGRLNGVAAPKHDVLARAKEGHLVVRYRPNIPAVTEQEYLEALRSSRRIDIIKTHTTKGVHRDDIGFELDGQDAGARASRGEYRSIILAVKLGVGALVEALSGPPVFFA